MELQFGASYFDSPLLNKGIKVQRIDHREMPASQTPDSDQSGKRNRLTMQTLHAKVVTIWPSCQSFRFFEAAGLVHFG
jgi:hypothetical protein